MQSEEELAAYGEHERMMENDIRLIHRVMEEGDKNAHEGQNVAPVASG